MTIHDIRVPQRADEEMLFAEFLILLTAAHISLVLAELSLLRLEDLLVVGLIKLILCATTFASSCLRSRLRRFRYTELQCYK